MHELGIVFHIIKQVDQVAAQNQVEKVRKVKLEIGEVSGVLPHYLLDCWKWSIKDKALLSEAELDIELTPAQSYCQDCKAFYATLEHGRYCPECGSERTYLTTGDEMEIISIEVD